MNRRLAGILIPVFSLRGEDDLGIGDVSSLHEFIGFASETGFGFVQLLPITETGPDNSPYNAISSVAIEPMTLDCNPEGLKDLSREAFEEVIADYDLADLNQGHVKYEKVRELKHRLLHKAFDSFCETVLGKVDLRAEAFEAFCKKESDWLNDYCLFRFLMDKQDGSQVWHQWPENWQDRDKALEYVVELAKTDPDGVNRDLQYYAFVQWIAFDQWKEVAEYAASKDVCLMGDIPFGVSLYSSDVWAEREIFDMNWYGGAPPEKLFKDDLFVQKWGQNWGIPLYNWEKLESRNYDWWRQRVRKTVEVFGMFRVDHALGFYRIYSFPWNPVHNAEFLDLTPEQAAARCGGREPGFKPRGDDSDESSQKNREEGEKYLRILQEAADGAEIIAEDLGTVPDYVRPSLAELGIAGMKVPQWEFSDYHVTSGLHYPNLSFAAYATHDHFPVKAQWDNSLELMAQSEHESPEWWDGRNFVDALCNFAGIERPGGEYPSYGPDLWNQLFRALCFSNSDRVAFLMTDLLMSTDRINVPGVMDGTNWSYRMDQTAKQLSVDPEYWELRENLKNVLNESSRSRRVGGF